MKPHIAQVAVPGPFWEAFDYLIPSEWTELPVIGGRVLVPWRHQEIVGIVVGFQSGSHVPSHKLKWLFKNLDAIALFDTKHQEFLQWLAHYYHAPLGDVYPLAMPKLLRDGLPAKPASIPCLKLTDQARTLDESHFKRTPKQRQLWQFLKNQNDLTPRQQLLQLGFSAAVIQKLVLQEYAEVIDQVVDLPHQITITPAAFPLNDDQQLAVNRINSSLGYFQSFLLFGVTGSGKTEVYLQVIETVLKQKQQALVLVPEIGLTPQTWSRFTARFGDGVVVLHSGLNDNERLQAWLAAKQGTARVVIGTRSALFVPFANLGIIIIDEEHDHSFKQQDNIRYSARDAAVVRANMLNVPIVLGSATPSLESWFNATQQRYQLLELPNRTGVAALPHWHLIDLRNQSLEEGISSKLLSAMQQHLANNQQVMLFLNRRGYAPSIMCTRCGWSPDCPHCDSKLTYHTNPAHLVCHYCTTQQKMIYRCKACQSKMQPLGFGTQRLEETIKQHFPNIPVIRIDRDVTSRKNSFEKILTQIHEGEAQILVGTQMIAKGHHFPKVTMVGILQADQGLYSGDFRATEHLAQLILQVAGRAGREEKAGEVYIQTYWPDHPIWQQLLQHSYRDFADALLVEREKVSLPPYRFMALIHAEAKSGEQAENLLKEIKNLAEKMQIKEVLLLGPVPAWQAKRAGYYRAQLLLITSRRGSLHRLLDQLVPQIAKIPHIAQYRWHVDVDPMSMG